MNLPGEYANGLRPMTAIEMEMRRRHEEEMQKAIGSVYKKLVPAAPAISAGSAPPEQGQVLNTAMAQQLLWGRLRIPIGAITPFEHTSIHVGKEKVYVFIVAKGGAVVLEEPEFIFPSDELIAKLRLLLG